ncbi:hypothetical protein D9M68_992890 [compost metagenome]
MLLPARLHVVSIWAAAKAISPRPRPGALASFTVAVDQIVRAVSREKHELHQLFLHITHALVVGEGFIRSASSNSRQVLATEDWLERVSMRPYEFAQLAMFGSSRLIPTFR